jgi:hypothetical protein
MQDLTWVKEMKAEPISTHWAGETPVWRANEALAKGWKLIDIKTEKTWDVERKCDTVSIVAIFGR